MEIKYNTKYNIDDKVFSIEMVDDLVKNPVCPICNGTGEIKVNDNTVACRYCYDYRSDKPKTCHYEVTGPHEIISINSSVYIDKNTEQKYFPINSYKVRLNEDVTATKSIMEYDLYREKEEAQKYCDEKGHFDPKNEVPF